MTVHRFHPDPDRDPPTVVLYDDCERCAEHAQHPFDSLDDQNLSVLLREALADVTTSVRQQPTDVQWAACQRLQIEWRRAEAIVSKVRQLGVTV